MPREQKYLSLILKKQPLGEGDELVTLYSKDIGKIRVLAKSTKLSKSRLQHALQTLFLTEVTVAGRGQLPKVIGAEVKNTFNRIRENLESAKLSFYALELTLKFTPDEQPNENLFHLLCSYFGFLEAETSESALWWGLAKFKIDFLECMGFAISVPFPASSAGILGFSNSRGGFVYTAAGIDFFSVSQETLQQFLALREAKQWVTLPGNNEELQHILSGFINYQLERDIKSEDLLRE